MKANNSKLKSLKWIYTRGIAGIDSLLPVYNDKGIEAAVAFDNQRIYTLELSIDLKLLGLTTDKNQKFTYHMVVNGEPNKYGGNAPVVRAASNPEGNSLVADQIRAANAKVNEAMMPRYATTHFWGEYTLAK